MIYKFNLAIRFNLKIYNIINWYSLTILKMNNKKLKIKILKNNWD